MEIVPSIMHSYLIQSTIFSYCFIGLLILAVAVVFLTIVYFRRVKEICIDDTTTVLRVYLYGATVWTLCLVGARSFSDNCFDKYSYGFLIDSDLKMVAEINEKESLSSEQLFDLGYVFNRLENYGYSLSIKPGENLALVGHTGAGKSSIARLIARFYEFQQGQILIDGQDIRSFNLGEYRKRLGIVSQVPFLFSGSVAENIRYAVPEVTDAEIERIARQIGDGDWLETLPGGLKTEVGERGVLLSMGQRQLVSLMRVLVQKPAIFILDEATASIDPFTEWQIQQALNLILSKTTSILIAHRLSTVRSADRIIVVENGRIIEQGSHQSLLDGKGHYATLYNTYFRHQSLAYIEEVRNLTDKVP